MRTISDERRREVAARLRSVETLEYDGDEWCDEGDVLDALGVYNNDDPSSCDPDKVAFLADLIDRPACKPVIPNEMDGCVFCPQCGAEIGEYGVPNYCYNCGVAIRNDYWRTAAQSCRRAARRVRDELMKVADECEEADVDGVSDWAARIRKAVGE